MPTTSNPQLNVKDEVFVVILEDGQLKRNLGSVLLYGQIIENTWDEDNNQYLYCVVTASGRKIWVSETHYNNSATGRTITKTYNTARNCYRANLDTQFP